MHSLIPDIQYPCGGLLVEGELLTVPGDLHSSPFGEVRVLVSILSSIVRVFVNLLYRLTIFMASLLLSNAS
jgi:hypothetical protein